MKKQCGQKGTCKEGLVGNDFGSVSVNWGRERLRTHGGKGSGKCWHRKGIGNQSRT